MSVPGTMRALIQKHEGYSREPLTPTLGSMEPFVELATIPVPQPKSGQVLVKVNLASINPSDTMFVKGFYGQPRVKGRPAGFEGTGVVVASGGGFMAGRLKGRRVAFVASPTGTWAEYAVAEAAACIPLMKGVRDEDAAGLIVNPLTAVAMFGIVRDEGARAFIMTAAASQLCKLLAGLARDEGFRAIAIVRRDEQIEELKRLGAAHVLNTESGSYKRDLAEIIERERPRILLDAVTGKQAAHIFNAMPSKARWIVYGRLDAGETPIPEPGQLIFLKKRIEGFWLVEWMRKTPIWKKLAASRTVQKRFADGRWKTDVTAVVPLDEAMARVPEELARPNGKVFIAP
jgi:NADPH:quinone reductase-like Zn-dependent oxidoreductase